MNTENFEYLKNELKYHGFPDYLNAGLENSLKEQSPKFELVHKQAFNIANQTHVVDYVLKFDKSKETDRYFFNSFRATLQNDDPALAKSQTIYMQGGDSKTMKETFNLLDGRAVNRDIATKEDKTLKFNAWRQLDFESPKDKYDNYKQIQFHQNYGYKVEDAVGKLPIKGIDNPDDYSKMITSLKRGNLHSVVFVTGSKEEKMYISANPKFKSVNVYDENLKPIHQGAQKDKTQNQAEKKEQAEAVSVGGDDESGPAKQSRKRR